MQLRTGYRIVVVPAGFAQFIGKPVTDLENMNPPDTRFVCKEDCVTTAVVRVTRLTVIYSRKTKRILSLACGCGGPVRAATAKDEPPLNRHRALLGLNPF
ncbi:hypothetical protein JQ582_39435 [Bradyrhizobium japonicum]|uniref:hypothetical protein n=1 Tax=Bradyrhizobium japonicum TaxID=375 RepID=UPI001BAB217C|nr:hypothetical protein [Bradyrhizobium japonicum]MBR0750001.1 hypothetical protein [Bradyrhizobium japonicum]